MRPKTHVILSEAKNPAFAFAVALAVVVAVAIAIAVQNSKPRHPERSEGSRRTPLAKTIRTFQPIAFTPFP
jgi:hypothetical protein